MSRALVAILAAAAAVSATRDVQLVPFGEFASDRTGRPGNGLKWKCDDARGQALVDLLNARHAEGRAAFNFDYEHATMLAAPQGRPAPASGWARKFEWRKGVGLFAVSVAWTAAAKASIDAEEYLYISPVIKYDEETGAILDVLNASLTNYPDLMGLPALNEAVASLNALSQPSHQERTLTLLQSLLAALGLPATTTEEAALTAVAAVKVKADKADQAPAVAPLSAAVATALGVDAKADEKAVLAGIAALRASPATDATTLATIQALQAQVAALSAQTAEREVAGLVDAAIKDGKLLPAQKEWAINLGKTNVAQLSAFIKDAPVVAAGLGATQTGGQDPGAGAATAGLSGAESTVLAAMGLTADEFKAGA